jgi:hypothetical protein
MTAENLQIVCWLAATVRGALAVGALGWLIWR